MATAGVTPPPAASHRRRFAVAYGLLAIAMGVAGGVLGYQLQSKPHVTPPQWSAWQPDTNSINAIFEIAGHVGVQYHLPNGAQLAIVKANFPGKVGKLDPAAVRADTIEVSTIALAETDSSGQVSYAASFPTFPTTVEYQLCGLSAHCGIAGGPTTLSQQLLQREGLELALYTLYYIPGVEHVVEIMPPGPGKTPSQAVLFTRGDTNMEVLMAQPLAATLPPRVTPEQQQIVSNAMRSSTYAYSYQQLFDGSFQMVLSIPHS